MKIITCSPITRMYRNHGQHCEQMLAYTLTGEIRTHDSIPFDMGSDIPEFHMSVKSDHATLVSANRMTTTTYADQIDEYFARVASTAFAYVTNDDTAYVMDAVEFRAFLLTFGKWERESAKNGGQYKIRLGRETPYMVAWLGERVG